MKAVVFIVCGVLLYACMEAMKFIIERFKHGRRKD
jgi:hypothetical protein